MEEEISASNVFSVNLMKWADARDVAPVTSTTGGDSTSDPNAGKDESSGQNNKQKPITNGDKAGAGILTVLLTSGWVAVLVFMFVGS